MQEVLVCNLPVRSGGLSNVHLDALIKQAKIKKAPDNNFLRKKQDKCTALSMAGADQFLKDVRESKAFKLLGISKVAAAGRVSNSLTEVKHKLEDTQQRLLHAEPPVPCDADAAQAAEQWHQALLSIQNRLADIKRMHGRTLGLAQSGPDKQRLIAEMKANQYAIKTALVEVTEKLEQTQSTAEHLDSPAIAEQAVRMNRVRETMGEEVRAIDDHIKEVQQSKSSSDADTENTTKGCHEVCAEAEQALSRTRGLLKAYTDRLPSIQDADRLVKMREALEERAASMKEVMRTSNETVDRVLNRLGALDGEVQGLDRVIDDPSKLAKMFRNIDALMAQHDEAAADASAAQTALKDAYSSLQSLQRDLGELVRMTGEHVDASGLADSAEMIAKLKRHISGSGGLSVALSGAKEAHADLATQENEIEGRLAKILQGLEASLSYPETQHGGEQESILQTIEQIEQRMAVVIQERDRMKTEMLQMTARFQNDMDIKTRELRDRLAAVRQDNEYVLGRVHDVVERMEANNQALKDIAKSIPNVDSQTIASVTNEQVSLLEDLRDAEVRLNHSKAIQDKIAYEASTATMPSGIDQVPLSQPIPAELSVAALQKVRDDTTAAVGEHNVLIEKLSANISREKELKSQPDSPDLADQVTALRGEIKATEQRIADQEARIRVQTDIINRLPQELKAVEDGDGAAKERLAAIESGLWDRVSQKDAAIEAIDTERNLQDSVDRETLRQRTDAMIAENNDRLRQITITLETLKSELETGADPSRKSALLEEQERTRRAQELHREFGTSLIEHKANADVPMQSSLALGSLGSPLTQITPGISDTSHPMAPPDTIDQQRAALEHYQEELAHQKQEIDRLTAQEAINTQLHDQYNVLKQQAEAVSNQLIDLLAPFGGNADALRNLVAEYAASSQKTRELTSENEQLREDLASTHRTMAEEYDRRIQQLQQDVAEAQRREAAAKVDTLETRRKAENVAQDLKMVQDSTMPLQGLPVLRFDEHHMISSVPEQAVRDIVKDYTFLRDDYGVVEGEMRDRIVAILRSLNKGSSVLDPDALPTQEDESPEVLRQRLKVYQESVKASMSKQLEAKKEKARLLALAYDASMLHDNLVKDMRKIPAPDGSIQEIGEQLTLVDAFISTVTRGNAGQVAAQSGLDSITEEDLKQFREDLDVMRNVAMLMTRIGGKNLDDVQAAVTAFALQHSIDDVVLTAVPDWRSLKQVTGDRSTDMVRATLLDNIQAVSKASGGAETFLSRMRVGRDSLAPVGKMTRDATDMIELALQQLSSQDNRLGIDRVKDEVEAALSSLSRTPRVEKTMEPDGMLGGAPASFKSLCEAIGESYNALVDPVDTFMTAWYSLVARKPIAPNMLMAKPPASSTLIEKAEGTTALNGSGSAEATRTTPTDLSRILAAFATLGWLGDRDFTGTETLTPDRRLEILQKLRQYGRCMDAQRRAWGEVTDAREAIKIFYLGDTLERYNLQGLPALSLTMSREQSDTIVKSLWPPQTQAGGAAVDFQSVNPYDVRKLNSLLISLNKIVMDRMKELGQVSTLRAHNEDFKVRYAGLLAALRQREEFADKLFEITKQSVDRALEAEEVLAKDVSIMDDMKLFLLGRNAKDTFNTNRNVLKKIAGLDWSGVVSDPTEEVVSFTERSRLLGWFSTVKAKITHEVINGALQGMARCARFLTSSSAFTEEDNMLTEIHEIRRNLREHLDELQNGPYTDAFFDHVQDLQTMNDAWYGAIKEEERTRQLRDFENQILQVLGSTQALSNGQDVRRQTENIMSGMLATARTLRTLVVMSPSVRSYVEKMIETLTSVIDNYTSNTTFSSANAKYLIYTKVGQAHDKIVTPNKDPEVTLDASHVPVAIPEIDEKGIDWVVAGFEGIPGENSMRITDIGSRLRRLFVFLTVPDAASKVVGMVQALTQDSNIPDVKSNAEKLQKLCKSFLRIDIPDYTTYVAQKLSRSVEGIESTLNYLEMMMNATDKTQEWIEQIQLMRKELSGLQLTGLQNNLQSLSKALNISRDSGAQKGGGNLIDTAADSLRTLFENVNAVASLLKPESADPAADTASADDSPFDPNRFLQRIAEMRDDEAAEMIKKVQGLQDTLRMQQLADPSPAQSTEAGIINLVLQLAVNYIELRQSCSQQVTGLKKQCDEQMEEMKNRCTQDVSRANSEKQKVQAAYVDSQSSDVRLSPSDIVYAFRSVPSRASAPSDVRPTEPKTIRQVPGTEDGVDGRSVATSYLPPPPMYSAVDIDSRSPERLTDSLIIDKNTAQSPDAHAASLEMASAPEQARTQESSHQLVVPQADVRPASIESTSPTNQQARPVEVLRGPDSNITDVQTETETATPPGQHVQTGKPVMREVASDDAANLWELQDRPLFSPPLAVATPAAREIASDDAADPWALRDRPLSSPPLAAMPVSAREVASDDMANHWDSPLPSPAPAASPTPVKEVASDDPADQWARQEPPPSSSPAPPVVAREVAWDDTADRWARQHSPLPSTVPTDVPTTTSMPAQAREAVSDDVANPWAQINPSVSLPEITPSAASARAVVDPNILSSRAPVSSFRVPIREVFPTQQGRKLEVVSDEQLAGMRAFDWRSLASSVGKLVRDKLSEPGTVAPEPLPPNASSMVGGADNQSDWKRDLFAAALACYVMHAILMRTPEIIRMVSVTETDPDGRSDTFTQAILNHSNQDEGLCRAFLDAVFVDVSAMRLPDDRVTSALRGFQSAIDRDTGIGGAQWLTLGEVPVAERRCVRVDDFFKYSCLLLRALIESQSDRSVNQDELYRDALYLIGQVVRARSEALSDPHNSLNLDVYRRVTTLRLGELKESHSRSGRAGVLTYLKFRNDVADSWNQRLYPSWNDEHFGTECYMQFNNHPFAYYDRKQKDGNVMPMVDIPSIERWGLKSNDGRSVDIKSYRYHYLLGPFTRVFGPADDAAKIAAESTDIKRSLLAGESIFLIGYGASGAGKTSTLICRSGSRNNCTGKDSGVLLNVLQDRDISAKFPTVSLTVCEFLAGKGDPDVADDRSKKIENARFAFRSGVYSFDPKINATSRYEGRWNPANSLDLAHDPMTSQPYNLSKIIAHTIDTDRLVKATTNNPNSSRSHVLVFVKLDPDREDGPCLIVGDFAGVENEFVCDSVDTLMQIYNQRDSSGRRMYSPKDLQVDREQDQQGRCKLPGSQRGGAIDDFVLYNDLTLDTQAVLTRQKDVLQQPELLEKLCGHPLDRTLLSTVTSALSDTLKVLDGAYPVSRAKADVSSALGAATAEREEAMYMGGDTHARLNALSSALQTALMIASTAALWNGKRDADNAPAIGRALTFLQNMYKPENAAVQARKNEPQWKGKVTDAVELDMLAFEIHSSRPGSVLGVLGLDGAGFGAHPRTSPKTPAIDGAISWLERSATKFSAVFRVVKQMFPDKTAEVAEILLSSWLGVHFAEFLSRNDTLTSMRSVCACRTHEGVFINDSLSVIRDVIRDLVQHQQAKQGRLMMAPAFSDMCLPLYCNPLADQCFGSSEVQSTTAADAEVILGRDRSRTRVMSMLLDVIGRKAAEKLRVAVFCILLMNRSENNDPMVPFIDAEDLRIELARIEKGNRNSVMKRMLTEGWVDTLSSYSQLSDPSTVNQGVIDAIKAWVNLLAPRLGQGLAQRMVAVADTSQARAIKLLTMLDRVNAVHPVGTLQFIDSLAKYNLTDAMCRFSCDSKITFARSLFERVLRSLENGQLGDFKSVMEDNLTMREYLQPPRDPVTANTYDTAGKSGWLSEKTVERPAPPVKTVAARAIAKPTSKRPATSQKRLSGGAVSDFNPSTVDEFLMQWATAVSERIAKGEEPVQGVLYSDFLQSCEARNRSRREQARGFKSLDDLIGPMQEDVRRGLPRRKSRRAR